MSTRLAASTARDTAAMERKIFFVMAQISSPIL